MTGLAANDAATSGGIYEQRHEALAELADRLRDLEDPDAIAYAAAAMLGAIRAPPPPRRASRRSARAPS
jgi:hypothetical protein